MLIKSEFRTYGGVTYFMTWVAIGATWVLAECEHAMGVDQ
jgi:hypothetical protein